MGCDQSTIFNQDSLNIHETKSEHQNISMGNKNCKKRKFNTKFF